MLLAAHFALLLSLAAGPVVVTPDLALAPSAQAAPIGFRGPETVAQSLEHVLQADPRAVLELGPEAWCPVGDDFRRWLDGRRNLAPPKSLAKNHGATPRVELIDGVVVIEDDGTLLRNDRRLDLAGLTVEYVPAGDGYTVSARPLAAEVDVGLPVFMNQRGWFAQRVDLAGFLFPFGGANQTELWLTSTFVASFVDPGAPGPAQLQLQDGLDDRTPRVAPLQQGTSLLGWDTFYRQDADRAVFTWRANDGGGVNVDVQAVLHSDGRIEFHYTALAGIRHGSPSIVTGDPAWWSQRAAAGSVSDPQGNVPVPAPDGPAIDIIEVRANQVGGSELVEVEVVFDAPLPAATDGRLQFVWDIRDEPGGPLVAQLWAEWEDGGWNWTTYPAEIVGNAIRFRLSKTQMGLQDDDFEVLAWSAQDWNYHQAVVGTFTFPVTPPEPLLRDLSAATGALLRGPIIEAFTVPELLIDPIYQAFMDHFGNPRIDGLAVYQNFATDIIFYAGAWSTVGNAGADGIGTGNSLDPERPALLHMNALGWGWNSWDAGKVIVLNHEFGHHWLYFPSVDEAGVVSKPLGDGHPAGWVHTPAATRVYNDFDASCMGGSTWTDNADGTFTSAPDFASYGYSWHELYFMGLASRAEAQPFFYLQDSVPALPGAYWPDANLTVTATRQDVVVDQFVTAMGPRFPAWPNTRRDHLVPMVLLVRAGEWAQPDVDEVARTCDVWADKFNVATVGRGTVACDRVGYRPPEAIILDPPADLVVTVGTTLDFLGTAIDPDEDDVELTWNFGALAPITTGPGPHPITFDTPGIRVIQLTAMDETGLSATWPALRIVDVRCAIPDAMSGLLVTRAGAAELALSWDDPTLPSDEYVLMESLAPAGPWTEVASGQQGLRTPLPPTNRYYLLAARNLPDCLGPL